MLLATHTDRISVNEMDHPAWQTTEPVKLKHYWSGIEAPATRHAEARVLWHDEALLVRFAYQQTEPLIVSPAPQVERKTIGLWDRDVCEIFIAPQSPQNHQTPKNYLEFEVAPTGEWLDLKIKSAPDGRETDWEFASGMKAAARIVDNHIILALAVPWTAFERRPERGDRWRANVFRCVGAGETRGYLAWQPTKTPAPNFHVPAAFGELVFQ
jgi:alpha-galactosidase